MANFSSSRDSCPFVKNILILDSEGKRVAVRYYSDDWPTNSARTAFEKFVFSKTIKTNARTEAEITVFDSNIVIYKFFQDLHFYVTGSDDENELILVSVLQGFFEAVSLLLRNTVDKREALENLDLIFLCFDEIMDQGMILEIEGGVIAGKVATQSMDAAAPISEQVISPFLFFFRNKLPKSKLIGERVFTYGFEEYKVLKVHDHWKSSSWTISQALATAREHFTRTLLK